MVYMGGAIYLLKIALGCTVAGLLVTVSNDEDVHNIIRKVAKKLTGIKRVKKFNVGNEHCTIVGLTQHGKTYATIKTLQQMKEPIFFFNTNHTPGLDGWVEAGGHNDIEQIIWALENGHKVNFLPSEDIDQAGKQLKAFVDHVYKMGRGAIKFRLVVDEVHLFWQVKSQEGKQANIRLATTALGRGIPCMWLSQRPAMVDNTLYTQSTKHIVFALGMNDKSYLKNNGFPVDEIVEKTGNEKYIFVEFDQKEVKGPFTIG